LSSSNPHRVTYPICHLLPGPPALCDPPIGDEIPEDPTETLRDLSGIVPPEGQPRHRWIYASIRRAARSRALPFQGASARAITYSVEPESHVVVIERSHSLAMVTRPKYGRRS
jgi:hypothetical protein